MTSAITNNKSFSIESCSSKVRSLSEISNRNINKINSEDVNGVEKYHNTEKVIKTNYNEAVNFFKDALKNGTNEDKETAMENVQITADKAISEFKSLISKEEDTISVNETENNKEKESEQRNSEKEEATDVSSNGNIDFAKFANRAQGIINAYVNNFVKPENSSTDSDKKDQESQSSIVDSVETRLPSLFQDEEIAGDELLNNDKNEYAQLVEENADKLRKMVFDSIKAA